MRDVERHAVLAHPDRIFVGNEWRVTSDKSTFAVLEASSGETLFEVAQAQPADIDAAVAAAREAFDSGPWPRMAPAERAQYLRAIADQLRARGDVMARMWTSEVGVLHSIAIRSSDGTARTFDYYADMAADFPFEEPHVPQRGGVGWLVREPAGVVGAIIPWNAPMGIIVWKIAPALLAGCTVIIKGSPEAPGAAYLFAEAVEGAGLPTGVVNVVVAGREVSELLVRDVRVDKITFTGSTLAGRRIASICGERIARCTLELGGKSAALILDDFDVETAVQAIVEPALLFSGQMCSALTRIIVGRTRHDDLAESLSAAFGAVRVGDPFEASTEMGPLATAVQRDRVEGYIRKGLEEGATLVTGGHRPKDLERGYYIEPTVFANVDNSTTIAREEIFGPVLSIISARNDEHAVDLANDSAYGLNASVFTHDAERAYKVARRIRSGTVSQNGFRTDHTISFGGFKHSGIGREGGREGLLTYLEAKTVLLDEDLPATGQ